MKKYLIFYTMLMFTNIAAFAQWTNSGPDFGNDKIKQNGNRLYLYNTRLYHSDDNGNTWEVENTPAVTYNDLLFLPGKIIAATDKGIFVSYNNGIDWVTNSNGITDSLSGVLCLGQNAGRLFAGTTSKAYYSDDNGLTWFSSNPSTIGYCKRFCFSNNIILLASNIGVMRSIDNGQTYNLSNSGISGTNPNISELIKHNTEIFCQKFTSSEIYKSNDDGLTWQFSNSGLIGSIVSASVLTSVNGKLFFATSNGVYEFNGASGNWISSSVITGSLPYRIIYYNQLKYFALNLEYNLLSTSDSGVNWTIAAYGLNMLGAKPKVTNNKLFAFSSGLFQFNEIDSTWNRFTTYLYDFGGALTSSLNTNIFCISYGAGNQYYIGTNGGVWSSNDNGTTWIQHHTGLPITNVPSNYKTVKDLYINGNVIVAATAGGLYRSTDQANTWTQVSTLNTNDLQKYGSYLYATGNGVYRSNDNGLTWTAFAGALSGGPFLYITGAGGKIFTSPQASGPTSLTVYADTLANSFTTMTINIGDAYGYEDLLFMATKYLNTSLSLTNLYDMSDNLPCYYASVALGCYEPYANINTVYGNNLWLGTTGFGTWYRSLADFGFPVTTTDKKVEEQAIEIFPNPTSGTFSILNATANSVINIYNLQSSKVLERKLTEKTDNINIVNFCDGIYFYQVIDNYGNILGQGKVVKY